MENCCRLVCCRLDSLNLCNIRKIKLCGCNFFQLLSFVKELDNGSGLSNQSLSQAVEVVKSNIAWIKRNEKDLENWLETFLSQKGL